VIRALILWLLCLLAAVVSLAWQFVAIFGSPRRALRIAIGFDQTANAAFGGDEDETISSRCWRYRAEQPYRTLQRGIDWLFGDPEHCRKAFEEERRKHGAC
jgi:hypothetical protein